MPYATTDDGVRLFYQEAGTGVPLIFVHEFAGDHRAWEPQMRHFARRYRAITYAARGYLPSEVPEQVSMYSQARAADDIRVILDHLGIDKFMVMGFCIGGPFIWNLLERARDRVVAAVAVLLLTGAVCAVLGPAVRVIPEREERCDVVVGDEPHAATAATIAAVGATLRHIGLATERNAARATVTTSDIATTLVDESRHGTPG